MYKNGNIEYNKIKDGMKNSLLAVRINYKDFIK